MEKERQESKLIRKSSNLIESLREKNLDFNSLFILECFYYKEDREFLNLYTIPSLKDFTLSTSYQLLKKQEYLVEDPNDTSKIILSVKGKDLVENLLNPTPEVTMTGVFTGRVQLSPTSKFEITEDEKFEEWWKTYPSSPAWKSDDGNTIFTGSRVLRNLKKAEAKKRYLKLLNQGLKHEELLGSLLYEIKLKKVDSVKKGQNQMEYFKGMESYFNQERYLLFIDGYRDNPSWVDKTTSIKGKNKNVTDI